MKAEGNIASLPKWARGRIKQLERELADAKATLSAGPDDSNVFADPYSDSPRPLGRDTHVEFHIGGDRHRKFKVALKGETLEVYAGDSIAVHPRSSNVVDISITRP